MIDAQARMLGTVDLFWFSGWLFVALAGMVWIARPVRHAGKEEVAVVEV